MTVVLVDVIEQVRNVVALAPTHVYPKGPRGRSVYVTRTPDNTWGCSCLIGCALVGCGIEPQLLHDLDDPREGFCAGWMLMQLVRGGHVQRWARGPDAYVWQTDRRILWLNSVQASQDDQVPWGFCIVRADAEFPLDA